MVFVSLGYLDIIHHSIAREIILSHLVSSTFSFITFTTLLIIPATWSITCFEKRKHTLDESELVSHHKHKIEMIAMENGMVKLLTQYDIWDCLAVMSRSHF